MEVVPFLGATPKGFPVLDWPGTVFLAVPPADASVTHDHVIEACVSLLTLFSDLVRQAATGPAAPIVVAVIMPPGKGNPMGEALIEACRGIVHSVTRETMGSWPRVNLLIAESGSYLPAVRAALDFLLSPGGGFTAGATLDHRELEASWSC